jgi:hypothetical protein
MDLMAIQKAEEIVLGIVSVLTSEEFFRKFYSVSKHFLKQRIST